MKYISYRVLASHKLGAVLIPLVLYSSASALYVNDSQTWTQNPVNIDEVAADGSTPLGTLEIGPSGNLTMTGRVNFDGVGSEPRQTCKLIMSGGILNTTHTADGVKFPDDYGPVEAWINAGTWTAYKIQHLGWRSDRSPATIFIGGGTLIVQTGYNPNPTVNRDWNPAAWIADYTLVAQDGYKLKLTNLGGGPVKIEGESFPGAGFKSPIDQGTETTGWPLWWIDGSEGPFDSYDVYLGTILDAVLAADDSRGPCDGNDIPSDIDGDCSVDTYDLKYVADQFLIAPSLPSADVTNDANVNLRDFAVVAGNWLDSNPFKGNQTSNKFKLWDLIPGKTYYWRIDARKGGDIIPSEVWSFNAVPRWRPDKFVIHIGWTGIDGASDKYGYLRRLSDLGINTVMERASVIQYLRPSYGIQNLIYDHPTQFSTAALYENDPQVFGYFQGSEPSESDLEYWAGYHWKCHWAAPSKPSWTDVQSINYGVSRSYIDTFLEMFNPEILVFDFYQWYWWWKTLIENLEYFRKKAIANDIPLYSWVEVDADGSGGETNRRRYHYSVYMNLTYGVKGICWFTASKIFNKSDGTIANQGYYDDVQAMNVEINNLGPELLGVTSTAVYHTGIGTEAKDWTGATDPMNPIPVDDWVQIVENGFGLGMFENAAGDDYVMVMNRDIDVASRTVTVQFKTEVSQVSIFDAITGTWSVMSISGSAPNQQVSFSTDAGSGKLLSVTKVSP
ncbi:MAG: hypothetical protein ACYTEL_18125 [Planctomycetota bacterium]|jgi:hypothetical protein